MKYLVLVFLSILGCQTPDWKAKDEEERKKIISQSNAAKFKFDQKVLNTLDIFRVDLNQFVGNNFVPQFKKALQTHFKDTEADQKPISLLPFFSTLTRHFPVSVLSRIRFVAVDKFPTIGELIAKAGIDRAKLSSFGVHIENEVWNFRPVALTLGNLIYIEKSKLDDTSIFFHECVHAVQYDKLGVDKFLTSYIDSIFTGIGYREVPFEMSAFYLQTKFDAHLVFDASDFIERTAF